jgi:hypothetical protein
LALDSNSGGTLGLGLNYTSDANSMGIHGSYSSRAGLNSVGVYGNANRTVSREKKGQKDAPSVAVSNQISSHSLNFVHPTFVPNGQQPMVHYNFSASVKLGASIAGTFPNGTIYGYYNESKLKYNGKRIPNPAFGYLNFDQVRGESFLTDVMREKEGMVNKFSPNLPIPHLTFDLFQVQSAGISGTIRPYRNQIEVIEEAEYKSSSVGLSAGFDAGYKKLGVNVVPSLSENRTRQWGGGMDVLDPYVASKLVSFANTPKYSFHFTGDKRVRSKGDFEKIGGFDATAFRIAGNKLTSSILPLKTGYGGASNLPLGELEKNESPRAVVQFLNQELINGSTTLLDDFKVFYKDLNGSLVALDRSKFPKHHIAGFVILDEQGNRYTYGLPVYNMIHEEYSFTTNIANGLFTSSGNTSLPNYDISGTKKYFKKTEIPPYAISYLLTSVQGPSYLDRTGNGVSPDDMGYWVKFNYMKFTTENTRYNWRDPFSKSHYIKGLESDSRDDLGSFNYGEKELYYLESAETKTHIAKFILEARNDARGVASRFQDSPNHGKQQQRLKEIVFFTREAGATNPLKKILFEFDYSLCQNTPNSSSGGKLTLKKLKINSGKSTEGSQTPYHFNYSAYNPTYDAGAKDRWGNYKPGSANSRSTINWSYVAQGESSKAQQDQYASAWNLTEIITPSSARILVDYESDDYAFVQNVQASNMTRMAFASGVQQSGEQSIYTFDPDANQALVRFPLQKTISGTLTAQQQRDEVKKYLDLSSGEVFVKLSSNLRKPTESLFEFVEGYLKVKMDGVMQLETDQSGNYAFGVFELQKIGGHHPFADLAWKQIEVNQPYLANLTKDLTPGGSNKDKIKKIRAIASIINSLRETIQGFTNYCKSNQWGKQIDLQASGVRLKNVLGKKFGGGHRVRQITIKDNWSEVHDGVYGQVFDYSIVQNGTSISSGVATYEPFVGGEENPLRVAKQYKEERKLKSDANFYFEYPINESLFPSPSIGYSSVKIMSLPSAKKAGYTVLNRASTGASPPVKPFLPQSPTAKFGTTGMRQLEFYTAKDFPTLTYETTKEQKEGSFRRNVIGTLDVISNLLTISQGYSIVINDMHGKLKSEKAFSQNNLGVISDTPISWTKYNYFSQADFTNNQKSSKLNSYFRRFSDWIVSKVGRSEETTFDQLMGVNAEVIVDVREISDISSSGGLNYNADLVFLFPALSIWPFVGRVENRLKTVVVNKVIYQFGIIESVESSNLGSKLLTTPMRWDILTGQAILNKVNNNFEAPIYSYQKPAYHDYVGMGPATKNLGFEFSVARFDKVGGEKFEYFASSSELYLPGLQRGDELGVYQESGGLKVPLFTMIFLGTRYGRARFYIENLPGNFSGQLSAKVIRSGFRNQLGPVSGSITSLEIPELGVEKTYSKTIKVPLIEAIN